MIATSQNFPALNKTMNIHAHTENTSRPAYISVNQSGIGYAKVSVRAGGTDTVSDITLSKEQATRLANDLLAWAAK